MMSKSGSWWTRSSSTGLEKGSEPRIVRRSWRVAIRDLDHEMLCLLLARPSPPHGDRLMSYDQTDSLLACLQSIQGTAYILGFPSHTRNRSQAL